MRNMIASLTVRPQNSSLVMLLKHRVMTHAAGASIIGSGLRQKAFHTLRTVDNEWHSAIAVVTDRDVTLEV